MSTKKHESLDLREKQPTKISKLTRHGYVSNPNMYIVSLTYYIDESIGGHSQLMSADISIFKIFLIPPPPQRKCPQKNVHSAINVR